MAQPQAQPAAVAEHVLLSLSGEPQQQPGTEPSPQAAAGAPQQQDSGPPAAGSAPDAAAAEAADAAAGKEGGEEGGPEPQQPPPACGVCGDAAAKYRCPGCGVRSCGLGCVKAHKEASGCSGKRDRLAFVPLADFGDRELISGAGADSRRLPQLLTSRHQHPCLHNVMPIRFTHCHTPLPYMVKY